MGKAKPVAGGLGTFAYVVTECEETAIGQSPIGKQHLVVQRGDAAPVTIVERPILGPPAPTTGCAFIAADRFGPEFAVAGVFQRLAVLPDGSGVVFEVTDQLAYCRANVCFTPPPLPPGASGMFFVRSDGGGLRRLGNASLEPIFFAGENSLLVLPSLAINPSGRFAAFTDRGPGPNGEDAVQIATLDLASGAEQIITRLPPSPPLPDFPGTCCPGFADDQTVAFASTANPDDLNPDHELILFTVYRDGTDLFRLPPTEVGPDSEIDPRFVSPSGEPGVSLLFSSEPAQVGPPGNIQEVLLVDGNNYLQLTDFQRPDTSNPAIDLADARVFFVGSADPLGTNPAQNCQVFAIDTTGAHLTQITNFGEVEQSFVGCNFGPQGLGCAITIFGYDAASDTLMLYSSCDPFGPNVDGAQIFSMRADGSHLRQLTHTRGLVIGPDTITAEIPGPMAYQGQD